MPVRAYVLVEAAVGQARRVGDLARKLSLPDARVISADMITGPYDVILLV